MKSAADGTAIFPPAELGARRPSRSPRLVHPAAGRMPDRTNRILVTAAGVTHRSQLAYWLRDGGCIDRLQFGVSSKPVNSDITMMTPFHVGNGQHTDGLRDQGLTVMVQNPLGAK